MPNATISPLSQGLSQAKPQPPQDDPLRKAALELEASFLAEMLKSAGLGESREGLGGGGAGE